jgi:hypothetical protein
MTTADIGWSFDRTPAGHEALAAGPRITYCGHDESVGTGMCLLCEELWMPFELPPQQQARAFVADAPGPDAAGAERERPQDPAGEAKAPPRR